MKYKIIIILFCLFCVKPVISANNIIAVENFDCLNTHGKDQEYIFILSNLLSKYLWESTDNKIMHRSLTKLHYLENELEKLGLLKQQNSRFNFLPAKYILTGEFKTADGNDLSIRFKYVSVETNAFEYSDWFNCSKTNVKSKLNDELQKFVNQKLAKVIVFQQLKKNTNKIILNGNVLAVNSIINFPYVSKNYAELLSEYAKISISENRNLILVNRENIDLFTNEAELKLSALSDKTISLGKLITADYLITCMLDMANDNIELTILIYEMQTGELAFVNTYKYPKKEFAEHLLKLPEKLPVFKKSLKNKNYIETPENIRLRKNEAALEFYNAMLIYNRAKKFKHPDELNQALTAANNAIMLDPEFVGSYFVRGRLLGLISRGEEEDEQHRFTIEKFPGDPWAGSACYYLAITYYEQKNYKKALEYVNMLFEKFAGSFMCGVSGKTLKRLILRKYDIKQFKEFLYNTYIENPSLESYVQSLFWLANYEELHGDKKLAKKYYEMCYFHYPDSKMKYALKKYNIDKAVDNSENKYKLLYRKCLEKISYEEAMKNLDAIINESGDTTLIEMAYKRKYFQLIESKKSEKQLIAFLNELENKKLYLDFVYSKRGDLKYESPNHSIENAMADIYKLVKINPVSRNYWKFHDIIYRYENGIKDPFREFAIAKKTSKKNTVAYNASKIWQNVEYYYASGFYDKCYTLLSELYEKYRNTRPYCAWAIDYMTNMIEKNWVLQELSEDARRKKWAELTYELITLYPEYSENPNKLFKLYKYYLISGNNTRALEIKKIMEAKK